MNKIECIKYKNIELKNNIVIYYLSKKRKENNQRVNYKKLNIN